MKEGDERKDKRRERKKKERKRKGMRCVNFKDVKRFDETFSRIQRGKGELEKRESVSDVGRHCNQGVEVDLDVASVPLI